MKINWMKAGKCILFLVMAQAAILLIDGSFWDDSLLSYFLPLFLAGLIVENTINTLERNLVWKSLVLDGIITAVFLYGICAGGGSLSAKNAIKVLIVFIGMFFVCYYLLIQWGEKKYVIRNSRIKWVLGLVLFCVFGIIVLRKLEIISMGFAGGCLAAYLTFVYIFQFFNRTTGKLKIIFGISCILALMTSAGYLDKMTGESKVFQVSAVLLFISVFLLWWAVWLAVLQLVFEGMQKLEVSFQTGGKARNCKCFFFIVTFMIFTFYVPYFISYYPGILSGDSIAQMEQVVGAAQYSNHHPIAHTMLIQALFRLGKNLGGVNESGVAAYTLFSMLFLSGVFAFILRWMGKIGLPAYYRVAAFVFYAIYPINAAYSITMWKDIIFSGCVLLYVVLLTELIQKTGMGKNVSLKEAGAFTVLGVSLCIFRGNGLYVWIISLPFVIYMMRKKWKTIAGASGIVLVLFVAYQSALVYYKIPASDFIESLSIPAQQIAYTIKQEGNISEDEYDMLQRIVDVDKIPRDYKEYISDPVKNLVREKDNQQYLTDNKWQYFIVYLKIGLKNPYNYLQAFVYQTRGYWFHKVSNWIYYPSGVAENSLNISRKNLLPENMMLITKSVLDKAESLYNKYFSLGMQTYVLIICMGYSLYKKKSFAEFIPLLGVVITLLIATPVSAEFRYAYPLFIALPVMPAMAMSRKEVICRQLE